MTTKHWTEGDIPDQSGRVAVVTGSNTVPAFSVIEPASRKLLHGWPRMWATGPGLSPRSSRRKNWRTAAALLRIASIHAGLDGLPLRQ